MKSINTLGDKIVQQHQFIFDLAKKHEIALCGGCAAAICSSNTDYIPSDIDLVGTKANGLAFINEINHFLIDRNVHHRIYVNSNNDFVPPTAISHFRIQVPFWLPLCLFIIPIESYRYYRIEKGMLIQLPQDVKQAARDMEEIDKRHRYASDFIEDEPEPRERLKIENILDNHADLLADTWIDGSAIDSFDEKYKPQ
jgi:hypothetical protein